MLRLVSEAGKPTTFRVRHFAALRERPSSTRLLRRLAARADWHAAGSSPARTETVGPPNQESVAPQRISRLSSSHSFHSAVGLALRIEKIGRASCRERV